MPGGALQKPSDAARAAICKRLPAELYPFVESAAAYYQIQAAHERRAPAPREVRKKLQTIAEQSGALYVALGPLSEEARNAVLDALPVETGWQILEALQVQAGWLMGAARSAALDMQTPAG